MEVGIGDKVLVRAAKDERYSIRKLGAARTEWYYKRLGQLLAAKCLEDVRNLPGNYHELKGDRKGQWACNLDNPYRLIFRPLEDPIPTDEDGKYIWAEILGVEIEEVVDYH